MATGTSGPRQVAAFMAAAGLAIPGIAAFEGYVPRAYADLNGTLTKCYGDTSNVVAGRTYSERECSESLAKAVITNGLPISRCVPDNLPPHTYSAFIRIAYNIGPLPPKGFCASSMSKRALAGDLPGACAAISTYVFTNGKDCRVAANKCSGLIRRRDDERRECEAGLRGVAQ